MKLQIRSPEVSSTKPHEDEGLCELEKGRNVGISDDCVIGTEDTYDPMQSVEFFGNVGEWFEAMEKGFLQKGALDERQRCRDIIVNLPLGIFSLCKEIQKDVTIASSYARLKDEVLLRTREWDEKKAKLVFRNECLGQRKPSELLQSMQQLVKGSNIDPSLLRRCFLEKLPSYVQNTLSGDADQLQLSVLGNLADKLMDMWVSIAHNVFSMCFESEKPEQKSDIFIMDSDGSRFTSISPLMEIASNPPNSCDFSNGCFGLRPREYFESDRASLRVRNQDYYVGSTFVVIDRATGIEFVIDSGADLSIVPAKYSWKRKINSINNLLSANDANISTYGRVTIALDLGLERKFEWDFVIADSSSCLIGADFLTGFQFLVDCPNASLIWKVTNEVVQGKPFDSRTL